MLKVLLTDIHFSHQSTENKMVEKLICDYIVISDDVEEKNSLEIKPFQCKSMSKSALENFILIQEIGKRRGE